ncbi:MAG: Imm32 family immunity protein [Nitrospinota bacterium]|nr:Imm32 family immunity protein [Nitrospinota bacterium]
MDDYLLTFELDKESEQIYVHGDPTGLEFFAKALLDLAHQTREGGFPHDHFFTKEWGGNGLSSKPQEKEGKLINHVKVYGWPDNEGAKPYEKT